MEQACSAILARTRGRAAAETASAAAGSGLTRIIEQVITSVDQIQTTEILMQRTALNAGLRAAHIGSPGDALGVLAGAMREGTSESGRYSDSLLQSLASLKASAAGLAAPSRDEQPALQAGDTEDDLNGMTRAVKELHSFNEKSFARIARIDASRNRVKDELIAARSEFTVGTIFEETIARTRRALAELAGSSRLNPASKTGAELQPEVAQLLARYTLQSERAIHQEVINMALGEAGEAESTTTVPTGDPLGDNVDFF